MKTFGSVDEYIMSFPPEVQSKLKDLRKTIKSTIPDVEEKISYGMAGYKLNGKRFVYFGGFQHHVSLFPASSSAVKAFEIELSGYATSKGTVRFPLDKPLPVPLIKKIIKFRANEILTKK